MKFKLTGVANMIHHGDVYNADNQMIPQHMEVYQNQTLLLDHPDVQLTFSQTA